MPRFVNYAKDYKKIIHLFQENVPEFPKIMQVCDYFLKNPGIVQLYLQEIDTAIRAYNNLKSLSEEQKSMYRYTAYLKELHPEYMLPDSCEVFEDMFGQEKKDQIIAAFFAEFRKMDNTGFFATTNIIPLSGTLFVGSYRTYLRVRHPWIIQENVHISSIVEEMLVQLAIEGQKNKLFSTIKFWIEKPEEGFTEELREKIKDC